MRRLHTIAISFAAACICAPAIAGQGLLAAYREGLPLPEADIVVTDSAKGGALKVSRPLPMSLAYPTDARARGVEGYAVFVCSEASSADPVCTIEREHPLGEGFAQAAVAAARAHAAASGKDIAVIPVVFLIKGSERSKRWGKSPWEEIPTAEAFEINYPRAAYKRNVQGRAVLACKLREDRRFACVPKEETPAAQGFGEAAVKVAAGFRLNAAFTGPFGLEVGDEITIPIVFRLAN